MTKVDSAVLAARVVLGWIVEPGNEHLYRLVKQEGPVGALDAILGNQAHGQLVHAAQTRLGARGAEETAEFLFAEAERLGARLVVPESAEWPSTLDDLSRISRPGEGRYDRDTFPPQAIWVRGAPRLDVLTERSVAIVGARDCTDYGSHVAAEFAFGLASRGWVIVSGGATGIDSCAHRGCLAAARPTIAVLAGGLDRLYPPANVGLFERITHDGLVISEWAPGADPHRHRFLIRNRVIAALTRGTVMVEAALRSGARQTLRRARQLGRAAMVVPGQITSQASAGCHDELRREPGEGIRLVTAVDHVMEEVGCVGEVLSERQHGAAKPYDALDGAELQLVDATPQRGGLSLEEIAARAGVGLLDAMAAIPSLVLRGYLREREDGTYSVILPDRQAGPRL